MSAQPCPDWGREGESWTVQPVHNWRTVHGEERCEHRPVGQKWCFDRAVACHPANQTGTTWRYWCARHMDWRWVERGRVVEWVLRPDRASVPSEAES